MLGYAAFFMLVFVIAMVVFFQMQSQELSRAENAFAQEVAYSFADSIRTAFIAGSGFSQSVAVPPDILGKPYVIGVSHSGDPGISETGFVYVYWQGQLRNASLSAPTVTSDYGMVTSGSFMTGDKGAEIIRINPAGNCQVVNMTNINGRIIFSKGCA